MENLEDVDLNKWAEEKKKLEIRKLELDLGIREEILSNLSKTIKLVNLVYPESSFFDALSNIRCIIGKEKVELDSDLMRAKGQYPTEEPKVQEEECFLIHGEEGYKYIKR